MKHFSHPNWYQLLYYPPSPCKVVPHHRGQYGSYSLLTTVWILLRPIRYQNNEELWDGAFGCSSLFEKSRMSNHLQMSRPWALVQPVFEPATSRSADRRLSNWANQAGVVGCLVFWEFFRELPQFPRYPGPPPSPLGRNLNYELPLIGTQVHLFVNSARFLCHWCYRKCCFMSLKAI